VNNKDNSPMKSGGLYDYFKVQKVNHQNQRGNGVASFC